MLKAAGIIAGTNSGCGKTTVTLALLRLLSRRGFSVQPFKCGPDYIDTEFHRTASGMESVNLDSFLQGEKGVSRAFHRYAKSADVAVAEGVMGLFDGKSPVSLSGTTAETAMLLNLPVILVVNVKGLGGSAAPLVSGFVNWVPGLRVAGVIANRVGSEHHAAVIREALAQRNLPPLIGWMSSDDSFTMPERYLGLAAAPEQKSDGGDLLDRLADELERHFNTDLFFQVCHTGNDFDISAEQNDSDYVISNPKQRKIRLAAACDEAFHFYYRENTDMLRAAGVEIVPFSPIHDACLPPDCQGIWIGGGFPELFAEQLSHNESMIRDIRNFARSGKLIYGECGGFLYLLDYLETADGRRCAMCGLLPGQAKMGRRLAALGYRVLTGLADCPFGTDIELRGHEFHYSTAVLPEGITPLWKAKNSRGQIADSCAGIRLGNVFASYAHLHFGSCPEAVFHFRDCLADSAFSSSSEL